FFYCFLGRFSSLSRPPVPPRGPCRPSRPTARGRRGRGSAAGLPPRATTNPPPTPAPTAYTPPPPPAPRAAPPPPPPRPRPARRIAAGDAGVRGSTSHRLRLRPRLRRPVQRLESLRPVPVLRWPGACHRACAGHRTC